MKMMLTNQIGCDAVFLVGDRGVRVSTHKYILTSRSCVFQAMFTGTCSDLLSEEEEIRVPDVEPEIFRHFLQYLYSDEVTIEDDTVFKILYTARKYMVWTLVKKCISYLTVQLSTDSVFKVLQTAQSYCDDDVQSACIDFIVHNATETLKSKDFEDISAEHLQQILVLDSLTCSEQEVSEAATRWSNAECQRQNLKINGKHRRQVLGDSVYLIRLPTMSTSAMFNYVVSSSIFTLREKLQMMGPNGIKCQGCSFRDMNRKFEAWGRFSDLAPWGWQCQSNKHAISFATSGDVWCMGVTVFGNRGADTVTYDVCSELYDETQNKVSAIDTQLVTYGDDRPYRVMFKRPCRLAAGRTYTAVVTLLGPHSYCGIRGKKEVKDTTTAVTVKFSNSTLLDSFSTTSKGQIANIVFE